jgi:hypothetical protein
MSTWRIQIACPAGRALVSSTAGTYWKTKMKWETWTFFEGTYADAVVEASRLKLESGSRTRVVDKEYRTVDGFPVSDLVH